MEQNTPLARLLGNSNVIAAIVLGSIVLMLIVPLPPSVLDILLAMNIVLGFLTLLISIYIQDPLQFAVFPSVLLVATLFRLALDISAARLILVYGHLTNHTPGSVGLPVPGAAGSAGEVIPRIANVMVKGDITTGL